MAKFLQIYLLVTGIGAFIALAMPSLVIIGFFMLILPGLILSLMPTAFMYGSVFAVGFFATRAVFGDGVLAILAGAALLIFVITTITKPQRARDMALYQASLLPNIAPAAPIELTGAIRFNFDNPSLNKIKNSGAYVLGRNGYACDSYCLAALFTPGVTSVTIDKSGFDDDGKPSAEARTYRLVPQPGCQSNYEIDFDNIRAPLSTGSKPGIALYEDGKVLVSQWAIKIANDYCVVMEAPLQGHDFTITMASNSSRTKRGEWSFGPGNLSTQTIEILAGDKVIYRDHVSSVSTISRILIIGASGGIENFRFGWERDTINNKGRYGSVDLKKSLGDATNLAGKPVDGSSRKEQFSQLLPALRKQLNVALNDPALTEKSPSFQVMENYFKAVGDNAEPEDVEILTRLFSDKRIRRYTGAWHLKLPAEQMIPIYNAYTQRVIDENYPISLQKSLVANAVSKMGPDGFKLIGPLQRPLLEHREKRLAVPELVKALGHGPEYNARNLLTILKRHAEAKADIDRRRKTRELKGYGEQVERDAHDTLIGAAKAGICIMAPKEPAIRQELEEFLGAGILTPHQVEGHDKGTWDLILARMGKPISEITKPKNLGGTVEQHRRRIESRMKNWKPDDCDRM